MANLFTSFIRSDDPVAANNSDETHNEQPETTDDLELPEGAVVPSPDVLKEAISRADQELTTPIAKRPTAAAMDSSANIMKTVTRESGDSPDTQLETQDDPNDDVLSMATDVNRHSRVLTDMRSAMEKMARQLNIIPEIDARIRTLTTKNDELESTIKRLTTDLSQVKQSFNMYQSSTANKIADVERRAAEHQLRIDVPASTDDVIPPLELNVERDQVTSMNRQSDTLPSQPITVEKKKKVANLSDF